MVLPELMTGSPVDRPVRGPGGIKELLGFWYTGFPQAQVTLDDLFAEGDQVVTRYTLRGTQEGAVLGVAPTGRPVTLTTISIQRLAGGKIAEEWAIFDSRALLQQIGVMPDAEEQPVLRVKREPRASFCRPPRTAILPALL